MATEYEAKVLDIDPVATVARIAAIYGWPAAADAELEIDEWPLIPPYLEIEAASAEAVRRVASLLGYDEALLTSENTTKVYRRYGIDLAEHRELRLAMPG